MNRDLVVFNAYSLRSSDEARRGIQSRNLMPLLKGEPLVGDAREFSFRYLKADGTLYCPVDSCGIREYKSKKCIKIPTEIIPDFLENLNRSSYLFVSIEGTEAALTIVVVFVDSDDCFTYL